MTYTRNIPLLVAEMILLQTKGEPSFFSSVAEPAGERRHCPQAQRIKPIHSKIVIHSFF